MKGRGEWIKKSVILKLLPEGKSTDEKVVVTKVKSQRQNAGCSMSMIAIIEDYLAVAGL